MGRVDGAVGSGRGSVGVFRIVIEGHRAGHRLSSAGRRRVRWGAEHADAAEHLVAVEVKVLPSAYPLPASGLVLRHGVVLNAVVISPGVLTGAAAATGR